MPQDNQNQDANKSPEPADAQGSNIVDPFGNTINNPLAELDAMVANETSESEDTTTKDSQESPEAKAIQSEPTNKPAEENPIHINGINLPPIDPKFVKQTEEPKVKPQDNLLNKLGQEKYPNSSNLLGAKQNTQTNNTNTAQAVAQITSGPITKSRMLVAGFLFLMIALGLGFYFWSNLDKPQEQANQIEPTPIVDKVNVLYTNPELGFQVEVKNDWQVSEFGTEVEMLFEQGTLNFEKIELKEAVKVDQAYCNEYAKGLAEALTLNVDADIKFFYFKLNDLEGCRGEVDASANAAFSYYLLFEQGKQTTAYSLIGYSTQIEAESAILAAMNSFELVEVDSQQ